MADWQPARISVVIPTYNRPELLAQVLVGLEQQTWPRARLEIIVVDDGGGRPAASVVEAAATRGLPVVLERQENAGPAAARNRGARRATGDVILFIDDDCVPTETLVAEHARAHRQRGLATIGRVDWHPDVPMTPLLRFATERFLFRFDVIGVADDAPFNTFYTANSAVDRQTAQAVGLFDEDFPRAAWEDTEFAYRLRRAGVRFLYVRSAVVLHLRGFDLAGFLRRERAAGHEAVRLWTKHPELRHLTRVDQIVGESVEFDFYDHAGKYAWLIGMSEALQAGGLAAPIRSRDQVAAPVRAGDSATPAHTSLDAEAAGPGAQALATAIEILNDAPELARWRDDYVRQHEAHLRQILAARQRAIDELHQDRDKLAQRAAMLERRVHELQQAFDKQAAWAADLESQLAQAAANQPRRRLKRLFQSVVGGADPSPESTR